MKEHLGRNPFEKAKKKTRSRPLSANRRALPNSSPSLLGMLLIELPFQAVKFAIRSGCRFLDRKTRTTKS